MENVTSFHILFLFFFYLGLNEKKTTFKYTSSNLEIAKNKIHANSY